jgi:Uma2 family endonuclease
MSAGMARCAVPARVQRAERMPEDVRITRYVAPLNAARTAQRTIPARGGIKMPPQTARLTRLAVEARRNGGDCLGFTGMAAILEIPEVRQRLSRLSVEEYHRLDEYNERGRRTELIRGLIIEKMSKSPLHRTITSLLYKILQAQLPAGYSVWKEEPLALADSEPEPDISVTRGSEKDFVAAHPKTAELVVEVAISSPALDRENASLYAEAGVNEYWIILGPERRIEVYRQPEHGRYRHTSMFSEDSVLECTSIPAVILRISDLFPKVF